MAMRRDFLLVNKISPVLGVRLLTALQVLQVLRRKRKRENLDSGCTSREREGALSDVPG